MKNGINRELKHRHFWATDGNWKLNFSLFGAFTRHRVCTFKPQSSTRAFPVRGKEQNHAKKGNIRLPVAVCGSRTSVLKLPNFKVKAEARVSIHPVVYMMHGTVGEDSIPIFNF